MAARAKNRKIYKRQLLLYPLANFIETSKERCLGDGQPKQLKRFYSNKQDCRQS